MRKLFMTDNEIRMRYRDMKPSCHPVTILAQLNATTTDHIKEIVGIPEKGSTMSKVNYIEVEDLYNQGKSDTAICKALKISGPSVKSWRERNGNLPPNGISAKKTAGGYQPTEAIQTEPPNVGSSVKPDPMPKIERVAAVINKIFDAEIDKMITEMPPEEPQPTTSGETAEFDEMPDPYDLLIKDLFGEKLAPRTRSKAGSIKVDIEVDTAGLNKAIEAIKSETARSGLTADFNRFEKKIAFLRGVAIGAGVRNIDELLETII